VSEQYFFLDQHKNLYYPSFVIKKYL